METRSIKSSHNVRIMSLMRTLLLGILLVLSVGFSTIYKITIQNPNNYNLTDYQVRIDLSSYLSSATNLKVCSDITCSQVLNFCYEQSNGECGTSPTTIIWVKVPSITTNSNTPIYVFTNQTIDYAVNGDQVFDFYDDFESYGLTSICGINGWECLRIGGSGYADITYQNGEKCLVMTSGQYQTTVSHFVGIMDNTIIGYVIEGYTYSYVYNEANSIYFHSGTALDTKGHPAYSYEFVMFGWAGTTSKIRKFINSNSYDLASRLDSGNNNVYYYVQFFWKRGGILEAWRDGNLLLGPVLDNSQTGHDRIAVGVWSGSKWSWCWIRLRKYADQEPTIKIEKVVLNLNITSPVQNQTYKQNFVYLNFSVRSDCGTNKSLCEGLVLRYYFDDINGTTVVDSSGNNINGTLSSEVEVTDGYIGKAVKFTYYSDGSAADFVTIPQQNALNMTDQLTITAWINMTHVPDVVGTIFEKYQNFNGYLFRIRTINYTDPKLQFCYGDGGARCLLSDENIPLNKWVFVAVTFNSGYIKLYLNGTLIEEGPTTGTTIINYNKDAHIGAWGGGPFEGYIDEIRLYNRTLNDSEIFELYEIGRERVLLNVKLDNETIISDNVYINYKHSLRIGNLTHGTHTLEVNVSDNSTSAIEVINFNIVKLSLIHI